MDNLKSLSVKSDIWLSQRHFPLPASFYHVLVIYSFSFARVISFCSKLDNLENMATLDADYPYSSPSLVCNIVCLFVYFVTCLGYFSRVYLPCNVKPFVLPLSRYSLTKICSHSGTMILTGLSLTISSPNLSVKLPASFCVSLSPSTPLIPEWLFYYFWQCPGAYTVSQSDPIKFRQGYILRPALRFALTEEGSSYLSPSMVLFDELSSILPVTLN